MLPRRSPLGRSAVGLILALAPGCFLPELEVEPAPVDEELCRACASTECASEYSACSDDPACDQLLSCALGCGDDEACRFNCGNAFPDALMAGLALLTCAEAACSDACSALSP
jgi:hypothetical protein